MTKKIKYTVTDSRGQVHTRNSHRTYTHAVVIHWTTRPADGALAPTQHECSQAYWCGRLDLAQKTAGGFRNPESIEILEAQVTK